MKQKVVIKVTSMNENKSRSKAMRVAVGISGVESAALKGDDKSQIEVTGDGMDPVALTTLLRKKVGFAELVSVGPAGGGEDKKDDKKKENEPTMQYQCWPHQVGVPHYVVAAGRYDPCYNSCFLM